MKYDYWFTVSFRIGTGTGTRCEWLPVDSIRDKNEKWTRSNEQTLHIDETKRNAKLCQNLRLSAHTKSMKCWPTRATEEKN